MDFYRDLLKKRKVFIIAEAGVNHNGRRDLALKLIDAAKAAGADAVKFQTFRTEDVITRRAEKARYQVKTTGGSETQFEMVKKLELSPADHVAIAARCRKAGIVFCSTPCDPFSVDLLDGLGVPFFKISSGEVTNHPLLDYVASKKRPIILSTGMSTLEEVRRAVKAVFKAGNRRLALLHCVTEYPSPLDEINMRAMLTMEKAFGLPVGYSDHTLGLEAPLAAVALGARIIEKHLTLNRAMKGPDHEASMDPKGFRALVDGIRAVESLLGDGVKKPAPCELGNRGVARRSLVAGRDIAKGERLTEDMIAYKRPGTGILPPELARVLGRRAKTSIPCEKLLTWKMLER